MLSCTQISNMITGLIYLGVHSNRFAQRIMETPPFYSCFRWIETYCCAMTSAPCLCWRHLITERTTFSFPLDNYSSFHYISSRMYQKRQKYWSALARSVISPFFCSESTLWWDSRKVATTETWDRFVFLLLYVSDLFVAISNEKRACIHSNF